MEPRPALYEIDEVTGEASGLVYWFCTTACRAQFAERRGEAVLVRPGMDDEASEELCCSECCRPLF